MYICGLLLPLTWQIAIIIVMMMMMMMARRQEGEGGEGGKGEVESKNMSKFTTEPKSRCSIPMIVLTYFNLNHNLSIELSV